MSNKVENTEEKGMDPIELKVKKIKKKYNLAEVYVLEIPTDDEGTDFAVGFLKKPNRHAMSAVMSKVASDQIGQGLELLLNTCLLKDESDPRILEDDDVYFGAMPVLKEFFKVRKGELKKF